MKIAYVISTNSDKLNGIGNKVLNQVTSWIELGEDARILAFSHRTGDRLSCVPGSVLGMGNPFGIHILGKARRLIQYARALWILFLWRPEVIYARAAELPHGSKLWKFLGARVICEINADMESQIEEDQKTGAIDAAEAERRLRLWSEALDYCDGVVSVSYQMDEVSRKFLRGQPHTVVWNSIRFVPDNMIERSNQGNTLPKLCFVGAEDFSWNGVDKLRDFAKAAMGRLEFVVIGAGDDSGFGENVAVHPYMEREEMLKVLAGCDVGLGTLALHRKGLDECSALKVRDYALLGMPMILAYKETPFVDRDLPEWVLEIENSESGLASSLDGVVTFAEQWKGKSFDPYQAGSFYDSGVVENRRLEFFRMLASG